MISECVNFYRLTHGLDEEDSRGLRFVHLECLICYNAPHEDGRRAEDPIIAEAQRVN